MNSNPKPDLNQQKFDFEKKRMDTLLQQFPERNWQKITSFGGIDIIACTPDQSTDTTNLERGYSRIYKKIGPVAEQLFRGASVFIAPDLQSGGQALPRHSAIFLDANKMTLTVGEIEDLLSRKGEYRAGDQSKLVGRYASASELGFVHELGHILEYRAHADMDVGFMKLNQQQAPTLYGQKSPREDYAESWLYYIYDGPLDSNRERILQQDILQVASA